LGSTLASQRYTVGLCRIKTQESAVFCGRCIRSQAGDALRDGRLLHSRLTDLDALGRRLLVLMPAAQRYNVHLCRIETREVAVFCRECIPYQRGDLLLNRRLLDDRCTESDALCGRLWAMTQASERYKVLPPAIFIHEVAVLNGVRAIPELDG